jgi:hypothetical protein
LLGARIFFFDNGLYLAVGVANDSAIAARIIEFNGQYCKPVIAGFIKQTFKRRRIHQRHVSGQYQHDIAGLYAWKSLLRGVPGTPPRFLLNPGDVFIGKRCLYKVATVTIHDAYLIRAKIFCRVDDMRENWPPGQGMQDFRSVGTHPGALSGRKNDDTDISGHDFVTRSETRGNTLPVEPQQRYLPGGQAER